MSDEVYDGAIATLMAFGYLLRLEFIYGYIFIYNKCCDDKVMISNKFERHVYIRVYIKYIGTCSSCNEITTGTYSHKK